MMDAATAMLEEATDEWLWPEAFAELRHMESALRCLICGDFFHGPVLLPCTHTFCSECVRRFLQVRANNGCCPECKQPCSAHELVPNRSLEKICVLFQQMKPRILPILDKSKAPLAVADETSSTTPSKRNSMAANGDDKPPERMTLVSYSVMKEKDIKKLLEGIGIRASIKNRDDIIQIHKEYVLLANAQADSSHPKSAKQIREEVMRNYRARQGEKAFGGSGRKSIDPAQVPVVTAEMQVGFDRLRQQVKARNSQLKAKQEEMEEKADGEHEHDGQNDTVIKQGAVDSGVWRHVHDVKSDKHFYVHSHSYEIRLQPPREFLLRQQQLRQRVDSKHEEQADDTPIAVNTRSASASQSNATTVGSDEEEDFVVITSPPPKPLVGSRNSTPQSARKSSQRRRGSVGSSGSSGVATAFFSQETSCSLHGTSTQHAPSASATLSFQESRSGEPIDLVDPSRGEDATVASLAPSGSKWECPKCTLVNDGAECEACGHQHRPPRKKQKLQFQSKIFASQT